MRKFYIMAVLKHYKTDTKTPVFDVYTCYFWFGFIRTTLFYVQTDRAFTQVDVIELRDSLSIRYGKLPILWE